MHPFLLYALGGIVFFVVASIVERQPGRPPWVGWSSVEWLLGIGLSLIWPLSLATLAWAKLRGSTAATRFLIACAYLGALALSLAIGSGLASLAMAKTRAIAVASAEASCPQVFFGGKAPAVVAIGKFDDLCLPAYALRESAAWRQPIWSAEHLVVANLPPAGTVRKNPFHAEDALPASDRAELADYAACNKIDDRGHATPVGDFTVPAERDDTFTLANMMAQTKVDNEQPWNHLENGVRAEVRRVGEAWIVTGPHVPAGAPILCGRVPQPDAIWKAVYFPSTGVIGAYWSPNDVSKTSTVITVQELTARTGVDPFPALSAPKKAEVHALPMPIAGGGD